MAFEYVRGYVQLASGLGELTKARAMEAAQGLLTLPGAGEVGKRALQVTEFADQLLDAARANRESLVALIRSEVESALGRSDVVRLADFDRARTALAALTREVDDLRASLLAEASRSPLGRAMPGVPAAPTVPPSVRPAAESASGAGPTLTGAAATSTATKATAKKATAKKATAKKATAKKATAKKATAKKATAKKATAKKATAKKATATAQKSAATTSATQTTATKKSATKKATAKKATTRKRAAKKSAPRQAAETSTTSGATTAQQTSTGNGNG